jgi:hypothetical protein
MQVSYNLTKDFVKLIEQKEGWSVVSEEGGVKIETRKFDDHHIICARGSCKSLPISWCSQSSLHCGQAW